MKEKWSEAINLHNDEFINDLLIKSFNASQDALLNNVKNWLIKKDNDKQRNSYILKYQAETYYMLERYKESFKSLEKLQKSKSIDIWVKETFDEIARK